MEVLDEYGQLIRPTDFDSLLILVIAMKRVQVTLTEYGCADELTATDHLVKIFHRLPRPIENKWSDKVFDLQDKNEMPSFDISRNV